MIINTPVATAKNKRIENDIYKITEFIVTGKINLKYLLLSEMIVQKKITFFKS
jgi:hypothetical protein